MDSNTFTTPKGRRNPLPVTVALRKETFLVTPMGNVYGKDESGRHTIAVPYLSPLAAEVRKMTGDFK